jgi:predicted restriction endonuclease
MSYYKCEFPNCDYESDELGSFDSHHIIPKSKGGSDRAFNRIRLCPNCHRKIYIEDFTGGIHSIKKDNSIIILGKIVSSDGDVLYYHKCSDNKEYYWFNNSRDEELVE